MSTTLVPATNDAANDALFDTWLKPLQTIHPTGDLIATKLAPFRHQFVAAAKLGQHCRKGGAEVRRNEITQAGYGRKKAHNSATSVQISRAPIGARTCASARTIFQPSCGQ